MDATGKSFAVLGLSRFGFQVAVGLFEAGADVIAVDSDSRLVERIADSVTKAACADVLDLEVLRHLGVTDVDVGVLGFRSSFDTAVLLTTMLHREKPEMRLIAQVDRDEKAEALSRIGAFATVFPERDIADRVVKRLVMSDLVEHVSLAPDAAVIEVEAPPEYVGLSLAEAGIRAKYGVYVIGVRHRSATSEKTEMEIAPDAGLHLVEGDSVLLLGRITDLSRFTGKAVRN